MSALRDHTYSKLNAMNSLGDLDCLSFEGVEFLEKEKAGPSLIRKTWTALWNFSKKAFAFIGELLKEDPASYNERVRRTPYDYPHIRGLN